MLNPPRNAPSAPKLRCLGGDAAPAGVAGDLRRVLALPRPARLHLWEILGPNLAEPIPPGAADEVARFCGEHGVDAAELAPAIRACRFLLRRAAAEDLAWAAFAADLAALVGDEEGKQLGDALLPGYDTARAHVRSELLRRSLSAHGKLLESVDWRLDFVSTSSWGKNFRIPVVLLTLSYREGDRADRITLQLLPETLQSLKKLWDRIAP